MTSSPFDRHREPSSAGNLKPGDVQTILAKDKQGNVIKTITLHRTERDYVFDLCDAYNAARSRPDVLWFVTPSGELRLGDDPEWARANHRRIESRNETERSRFNRLQLEAARSSNAYQGEDA